MVTTPVYDAFLSSDHSNTFFHGHSFAANPLACAVALASLDLFDSGDVMSTVRCIETQLVDGLSRLRDLRTVGDVRVIGAVGVIELLADMTTSGADGYLDRLGPRLAAAFLERGLLLRPLGNVLYFMPPYVITPDEVDWCLSQIVEVIETLDANSDVR